VVPVKIMPVNIRTTGLNVKASLLLTLDINRLIKMTLSIIHLNVVSNP